MDLAEKSFFYKGGLNVSSLEMWVTLLAAGGHTHVKGILWALDQTRHCHHIKGGESRGLRLHTTPAIKPSF